MGLSPHSKQGNKTSMASIFLAAAGVPGSDAAASTHSRALPSRSARLLAPELITPPAYSHECTCDTAPVPEGSFLFYNRVPKCGSTTMLNFVEEAARRNGFASASSHVRRARSRYTQAYTLAWHADL